MPISGDPANPNLPTSEEREMYLKKIHEWRELGFDTENLEDLLDSDFGEFKRKRLQILKSQVGTKDEILAEARRAPAAPGPEPTPPAAEPAPKESLMLLGEPVEIEEPEVAPKKKEEAVIHVGKPVRLPTRKARRKRAADRELEAAAVEPMEVEGIEEGKDVKFKIMDLKEGDVKRDEEELEEEEEEEFEEEEEEAKPRPKRRKRPRKEEKRSNSGVAVLIIIIIVIIASISSYYYFILRGDGDGDGTESDPGLDAIITVQPAFTDYNAGEIIIFDAIDSEGDIDDHLWKMDNDFKIIEGALEERKVTGYFSPSESTEKNYTVTLTIKKGTFEDSDSIDVTVMPLSIGLTSERLDDYGEYDVDGFFDLTNPDGIVSFKTEYEGEEITLIIRDIHIDFNTQELDPMNTQLKDAPNIEDGFWQKHSTYKRETNQNLELSGEVKGTATHPIFPEPYEFTANIDGNMDSADEAYTDYKTLNTIKTYVVNDIDLTISIANIPIIGTIDMPMTSHNELRSYPDLRKEPQRFRIEDLSTEPIELGHTDAVEYGDIIYIWNAESVDFVYNNPAIKVNLTLDSSTMARNNLDEFFMNVWVAEDVSFPVRTYIYIESTLEGNTTTLIHKSVMKDYSAGSAVIPDSCAASAPGGSHYYFKVPNKEYQNNTDWEYLPSEGQGTNSFNAYPPEQAIQHAESDAGFIAYKNNHPDLYVVNGYCSGTGERGIQDLFWNLTFGEEGGKDGFNILVDKNGVLESTELRIDAPPNSTREFDPILTFASSEQILVDLTDTEIDDSVFNNQDEVDFSNVSYGIRANVAYPTIDITSIQVFERSKYAFYIQNPSKGYTLALDAETGQLLFTLKSSSSGYEFLP